MKAIKIIFFVPMLLAACATAPQMGESPDPSPPRLVSEGKKNSTGREVLRWDRSNAFARVSPTQKLAGDIACMTIGIEFEAVGYHPGAMDLEGKKFPKGGYFCVVKESGSRPQSIPPRLVRIGNFLGWDKPSAFGSVPESEKDRGDSLCRQIRQGYEAIGFHPQAQNENGSAIIGGGFFCAPILVN